jgi:glutamate racemase
VTRYAVQATRALMRFEPKMIVVACNTVSAVALPVLTAAYAPIPVVGVVEPGARAAVAASRSGAIAVIATEGTVRGGAYLRAIHALNPGTQVVQCACPLFVALAEEGWTGRSPNLRPSTISDIFERQAPDTLVLGCTHFRFVDDCEGVRLARRWSTARKPPRPRSNACRQTNAASASPAELPVFLATDAPERFALGSLFLGSQIEPLTSNSST